MKIKAMLLTAFILVGGNLYAANGDLVVHGNFNQLPAGSIMLYGGVGATLPSNSGWLIADGSAVSRTTYAALFAAIGVTFGAGDGTTTFNLPDFKRRVGVGAGGTGTAWLGSAIGNNGGEEMHTITVAEMPSHTHPYNTGNNGASAQGLMTFPNPINGYDDPSRKDTISIGNSGGNSAHNIIQPSLVVNYIIKY